MKSIIGLLFVLCASFGVAQSYVIHAGFLITGNGNEVLEKATIRVENNIISSVEEGFGTIKKGEELIDLSNSTVSAGWMDMHVHLEKEFSKNAYLERFTQNPADIAFKAQHFAKINLLSGFTTVRDLGGTGVNIALRDAINSGLVIGPRVITSGKSIATTGGHADPTNGCAHALMGDPGPAEGVANGPAECADAVRHRYKNGADCIKITATGGVLSVAKNSKNPQFQLSEVEAIVVTATDYEMHVAAHAHGKEGMLRAVKAGVRSIEHGTYMDEEVILEMKNRGTWYIPTITAGKAVGDSAKIPGYYPDVIVPKALEIGPKIQATFTRAYQAGVNIAFGTDAGVFRHGESWREFGYMVDAGMSPIDAVLSATLKPAQLLGIDDQFGTVEQGKIADLVAVEGNWLNDISKAQNVVFVMKDGKRYK